MSVQQAGQVLFEKSQGVADRACCPQNELRYGVKAESKTRHIFLHKVTNDIGIGLAVRVEANRQGTGARGDGIHYKVSAQGPDGSHPPQRHEFLGRGSETVDDFIHEIISFFILHAAKTAVDF